jgi:glycosyltransferase involved in cell wall biosynthesis
MIRMQPDQISVTVSLGSCTFQNRLAAALLRCGMLRRVLRFGPDLTVLDPNRTGSLAVIKRFPEYKVVHRLLWAAWRRLPGTGRSPLPVVASSWLADRLASKYVPPSRIFHGYTALCLACLQAAKRQGAVTVVHNPTLHPRHWQREVMAECKRVGINPRNCYAALPTSLIRRREREYELCDRIIVLSSTARQSFEEFSYGERAVVVWPGVDHLFFTPPAQPAPAHLFRVCYVGRVEITKGIGYLLPAWKRLALPNAELILIGQLHPETDSLFREYAAGNLRLLGTLPPQEVAERYRESSLFVLPSVMEGLANVLLEAMASGLPVVATDQSGAADCVTSGKDGFVVPARNIDTLAEAILWCYQHRDKTMAMGKAARVKVEQLFTLSHYEERQIALYRSLGN